MTWDDWAEYHATLFAYRNDNDLAMLAQWVSLFAGGGFLPAEMRKASDEVARMPDPPRWREDQLFALQRAARAIRAREAGRPTEQPTEVVCRLCSSSGRVSVPDHDSLAKGQWAWLAVLCRCPLGLWFRGASGKAGQCMTIEQYERLVPDWRDLVKRHQEELRRWAAARSTAGHLDKTLGQILDRMRHKR